MYEIYQGDVIDVLKTEHEDNTFDAVLCDPPYGLSKEPDIETVMTKWLAGEDYKHRGGGFMGKTWDSFVPGPQTWKEINRVMKPGAHLLSFGGPRTQDLLGIALRMGKFELRDVLQWVFGQGFPKSYNISKSLDHKFGAERKITGPKTLPNGKEHHYNIGYGEGEGFKSKKSERYETAPATEEAEKWEGYGTNLKPAYEPIILARKKPEKSIVNNCIKFGTGGLNIDDCRIGYVSSYDQKHQEDISRGQFNAENGRMFGGNQQSLPSNRKPRGRFPANFIHDGSEEVLELFPDTGKSLGGQCRKVGMQKFRNQEKPIDEGKPGFGDSGSAARFFYTAKVSPFERNTGLEDLEDTTFGQSGGAQQKLKEGEDTYQEKGIGLNRIKTVKNDHPTLKPISLTQYLATLILPPERETPRKILVPFSGSGSEMIGALLAEWDHVVGIEWEEKYIDIADKRIQYWINNRKEEESEQQEQNNQSVFDMIFG